MPPQKPVKPNRKIPSTQYKARPSDEENAGRLFRVRCKDWENLWGENLTHADATQLKEQVVTRGRSRTARVEDMTIPPPDWYTAQGGQSAAPLATGNTTQVVLGTTYNLEEARRTALAEAKKTAATAQQRHAQQAAKDRSSGAAAKTVARSSAVEPPRPVPAISTDDPTTDALEGVDVSDLMDGSGTASDNDVSRARREADREIAEIEAKAKALYEQACKVAPMPPGGHVPWEKMNKAGQAGWKFNAADPAFKDPRDSQYVNGAGAVDQISDDPDVTDAPSA